MDAKDQFQKVLQWMRQISQVVEAVRDGQETLISEVQLLEKKLNLRIDGLDERFDALSDPALTKKFIKSNKRFES